MAKRFSASAALEKLRNDGSDDGSSDGTDDLLSDAKPEVFSEPDPDIPFACTARGRSKEVVAGNRRGRGRGVSRGRGHAFYCD